MPTDSPLPDRLTVPHPLPPGRRRPRMWLLTCAAVSTLLATACSGGTDSPRAARPAPTISAACKKDVKLTGLTVATDQAGSTPWFDGADPSSKKGFESALVYALAHEFGLEDENVTWVSQPVGVQWAPGPKGFSFAINQFVITEQITSQTQMSDPYLNLPQVVLTRNDSSIAAASESTDLADARFAVITDTPAVEAAQKLNPDAEPAKVADLQELASALFSPEVDGAVTNLQNAMALLHGLTGTSGVVATGAPMDLRAPPNLKALGRIGSEKPVRSKKAEQLGLVVGPGNALTDCLNAAIGRLSSDGTISKLAETWLYEPDRITSLGR